MKGLEKMTIQCEYLRPRRRLRLPGRPVILGLIPAPPERVYAVCRVRSECTGCTMPAHGFVCHFGDGTCLRHKNRPDVEEQNQ